MRDSRTGTGGDRLAKEVFEQELTGGRQFVRRSRMARILDVSPRTIGNLMSRRIIPYFSVVDPCLRRGDIFLSS